MLKVHRGMCSCLCGVGTYIVVCAHSLCLVSLCVCSCYVIVTFMQRLQMLLMIRFGSSTRGSFS